VSVATLVFSPIVSKKPMGAINSAEAPDLKTTPLNNFRTNNRHSQGTGGGVMDWRA
jgi:hypothetical protein